jgi:membrane-associated protease RseP (regulator of RpoE activity)
VLAVWRTPALLASGLAFTFAALTILLCHEMGHWLACRHYRLEATPPYFLPLPFALGTLGAFIRIRSPIVHRRMLFDVGAAGPFAGFVALVPFLFYGLAHSPVSPAFSGSLEGTELLLPGRSLLFQLGVWLFQGREALAAPLALHPFALAAWVGLLATALNLLPLGQLDGGHVLYAAVGPLQGRLAYPLLGLLAALGFLWPGWWLWCVVLLFLGARHPPVLEPEQGLDPRRRWLAWLALVVFLLSFMPVPLETLRAG